MPDLLTLDTKRLLDYSDVGRQATRVLEQRWAEHETKDASVRAAALEHLERQRVMLREALIARATTVVQQLAKQKNARWVIEASSLLWGEHEEITATVIQAIDAQGPLSLP